MSYVQIVFLALVYGVNLLTLVFIIFDTRNASKALGYMLLVITVPIVGPLIYFSIGVNYRQRRIYNKKLRVTRREERQFYNQMVKQTRQLAQNPPPELAGQSDMVNLLLNESQAILSFNRAQLLLNGEEKFPRVLAALAAARHHIHLEYYIYEDDRIGNQIKDVLVAKAREGVKVRFIYDAFGSKDLSSGFLRELHRAGVEVHPFSRIYFVFAASR
ncbi:MAG TPA: cardiolipin synthase, partial [Cytophagales bacterium]|nr:cardiolipin synthase [Cytophagales bacterium]